MKKHTKEWWLKLLIVIIIGSVVGYLLKAPASIVSILVVLYFLGYIKF